MPLSIPSAKDKGRFVQLWIQLHPEVGVDEAWQRIVDGYTERHRRYHNWDHILWCLKQFDLIKHLLMYPDLVEFAIYFHDVVYRPGASDNEERSADVAMSFVPEMQFPDVAIVRILILDTKHNSEPRLVDGEYLADIDLSSMGDDEQNARYAVNIREEFLSFVPAEIFDSERKKFIQKFIDKPRIYYTDFFHQKYGEAAKRNLEKQLEM